MYTCRSIVLGLLLMSVNCCVEAQVVQRNSYTDHHVHLQDSSTVQLGYRMLKAFGQTPTRVDSLVFDADTIIQRLNKAKFKDAWILSNAYWFGSPLTPVENEYAEVKKQNDWTAAQAARYPERLRAFMSVSPLKPYALEEIQRCVDSKHFTGLKLHFANSKINLFDKDHVERLQQVFALANKNRLILVVHLRSEQQWDGRANSKVFLNQLMPFAKDTRVVIAHLAGWGGYDAPMDDALEIFTAYIHWEKKADLYFDVSAVLPLSLNPATKKPDPKMVAALKKRVKQIGTNHLIFGTDWPMIDIDPYTLLLTTTLSEQIVRKILERKILLD